MNDIIIIGAGTAGLTAGIYGVRSGKSVLLLDEKGYGGQIINTLEVENYPGIKHISGYEFATELYNQAIDLGAKFEYGKAIKIIDKKDTKMVITETKEYECKTIIIATGSKHRHIGIEREEEFTGKGISYCATCDGVFFRGKDVAVVGGGNTALGYASFLSNYCNKVYIIHKRDKFRGEEKLLKRLEKKDNIKFVLNSNIVKLNGNDNLESVNVLNSVTEENIEIKISGLFVAIGQIPGNDAFSDLVELDDKGYIIASENCKTRVPGIFVAGDCRTKDVRQLTTATADGSVAALEASEFI